MSRNKRAFSLLKMGVLCLALLLLTTACAREPEKQAQLAEDLPNTEQPNYKTVQVELGEYEKQGTGSASVIYLLKSELRWEKNNACYQEAMVAAGQKVKAGEVLMRFDVEADQVGLESLKLQLRRTKENVAAEKERWQDAIAAQLAEAERLQEQESQKHEAEIAKLKADKLQAEYDQYLYQSRQETERIEEQISEMEQSARENVLTAPFDGVIESVTRLNEGDKVTPGQVLVTMYATDKLMLKADNTSGKLRYNMDVTVTVGNKSNQVSYSGRVVAAPNILPSSVSQDLTLIELDEEVTPEELKGALSYRCATEALQNILVVDRKAVHTEDNKAYVNVLENDMVQKRYVVTVVNSGETIWILDGLSEGQTLILD